MKVGDKVKLLYSGFKNCPRGTVVKIISISERTDNISFAHNGTGYTVADNEVMGKPEKEKVTFT